MPSATFVIVVHESIRLHLAEITTDLNSMPKNVNEIRLQEVSRITLEYENTFFIFMLSFALKTF